MGEQHLKNTDAFGSVILGIAHELNNPNTFIRVNATNLKKLLLLFRPLIQKIEATDANCKVGPYKPNEAIVKMVQFSESILEASIRLISIADKLKQCTSMGLQEKTSISITNILDQLLGSHHFLFTRLKTVSKNWDSSTPYQIHGHALEIDQALSIIVTNAVDAINARYGEETINHGVLDFALTTNDTQLIITITDNGCGMDEETISKIFQPYYTTKTQGTGDGIGLTLCQSIIGRHNGNIRVNSKKDLGTTFEITLPKEE